MGNSRNTMQQAGAEQSGAEIIQVPAGAGRRRLNDVRGAMEKIEKMISIVRDISAKTDLLALNASIEAARAGQAGKGFAVVAHEVARLAEKSQESIEGVEAIFGDLRDAVRDLGGMFGNGSAEPTPEDAESIERSRVKAA